MFTPTVMILKTSSARKTATVTVITLTETHLKIFSNTLTAGKVMITTTATMMMTATMTVTAQATILLKASAKAITAVTPALPTHPLTLQA